jgi:FtsP/CotA-like multicopper oxidase with cupredoxin domain
VITPREDLLTMVSSGTPANDHLPTGPIGNPPDLRSLPVDVHRTILFTSDPVAQTRPTYRLDHQLFSPKRVDITMKLNSLEEWTLTNPANGPAFEYHTFHIHQNPFQVVSINGKPLNYVDWQDNVTLAPGETIVIRIHPIDFTGEFVFHCHVIFHEDNGMMGTVQVLAHPTAAQVNLDRVMYLVPPTGKALYAATHTSGSGVKAFLLYCHLLLQGVT